MNENLEQQDRQSIISTLIAAQANILVSVRLKENPSDIKEGTVFIYKKLGNNVDHSHANHIRAFSFMKKKSDMPKREAELSQEFMMSREPDFPYYQGDEIKVDDVFRIDIINSNYEKQTNDL